MYSLHFSHLTWLSVGSVSLLLLLINTIRVTLEQAHRTYSIVMLPGCVMSHIVIKLKGQFGLFTL